MSYELPDFDTLKDMAENNPEALEDLRQNLTDQLIEEAPEKYRRKLRGLQFRVDMERRRAKSPMAACIAISGMMHDSFDRLRCVLNEAAGDRVYSPSYLKNEVEYHDNPCQILPFHKKS